MAVAVNLELRITHDRDVATVWVNAEVDLKSSDALAEVGLRTLNRCTTLIVDLSAVTFLDSSGLNALARIRRAADASQRITQLRGASDHITRLLDITGLGTLLGTVGDDTD